MTRDERGVSESLQWALLAPMLLAVLLGALQVALAWHARNVAVHAAAAAAEAEAAYGARPGDGRSAALAIARAGGLDVTEVEVQPGPTTVRVRVAGRAPLLVDLGMAAVDEAAVSPRERVR